MRTISSFTRKMAVAGTLGALLLTTACGAGSRTAAETAKDVGCDVAAPSASTTVNVLAYNSSAIDPFTNTMVASCSKDNITIQHDPIDFAGQIQKTAATLASDTGSYDILETYSLVVPQYADQDKLVPLDDLFAKYKDKYKLGELDKTMLEGMSYKGKLYGLPTQASVNVMVYRKDILDELKIDVPKTFPEVEAAAAKIKASGKMQHPVAMPLLASGDISTRYMIGLHSLGTDYVDPKTNELMLNSPQSKAVLNSLKSLSAYMDPQVTTFDQPKVQQQLFNGTAAIATMYSGRMIDLLDSKNTKFSEQFGFAATPTLEAGGKPFAVVSVDGWSIPKNSKVDPDMLFQIMAASIVPEAGKEAVPAAYPSRKGLATVETMPWMQGIEEGLKNGAKTPLMQPWTSQLQVQTRQFVAQAITGALPVDEAAEQMQQAGKKVLAEAGAK
jgi:multiple sugar transport system substrate-binding protein